MVSDPRRPDWSYLRPMVSTLSGPAAASLLGVITAVLLTLSLVGCAPEESVGDRPVTAPTNIDCPGQPVPTELTVTCHRIEVDGASLAVAVLHGPDPDRAPVLFLHGGPGGRAVADRDRWLAPRSELLANHDVVLVDQRGGGNSTPSLDCPEMEYRGPEDNAPEGLAEDRACRNRLVSAGFEPSTVTVGRIAADLVAVRRVLAIDRWHLYGVSYGTRIALELLRIDDAAIVSLALDSVVPPDADETADLPDGIVAALAKLEDRCTDDGSCPVGVLEPLRRTLDRLARDPTVVQIDARSLTFDDTAFLAASVRTLSRPDGPMALTEAIALADAGRLAEAVDRLAPVDASAGTSRSAGDTLSEGAWVAVTCGDQRPGMAFEPTDLDDPVHRAEHGRWSELRARCAAWKIPSSDPATRTPVRSAVPTLILAGELDPITPARWAETVARWLDDVEVVVSPRWTHAPSTWNPCATHLVTQFLDTGDRPTGGSANC